MFTQSVRAGPPKFCPTVSRDLGLADDSVQLLSLALGPEELVISQTSEFWITFFPSKAGLLTKNSKPEKDP